MFRTVKWVIKLRCSSYRRLVYQHTHHLELKSFINFFCYASITCTLNLLRKMDNFIYTVRLVGSRCYKDGSIARKPGAFVVVRSKTLFPYFPCKMFFPCFCDPFVHLYAAYTYVMVLSCSDDCQLFS